MMNMTAHRALILTARHTLYAQQFVAAGNDASAGIAAKAATFYARKVARCRWIPDPERAVRLTIEALSAGSRPMGGSHAR